MNGAGSALPASGCKPKTGSPAGVVKWMPPLRAGLPPSLKLEGLAQLADEVLGPATWVCEGCAQKRGACEREELTMGTRPSLSCKPQATPQRECGKPTPKGGRDRL